jgi:hypothetical protein
MKTASPPTTSKSSADESSNSSSACVSYDEGSLVVCFSRAVEVRRTEDDRQTRWCFGCRAHVVHERVVYADPMPSYYEPQLAIECTRCHKEDIYFPGCGPL